MNVPGKILGQALDDLLPIISDVEKLLAGRGAEYSREAIEALRDRLETLKDRLTRAGEEFGKQVATGARCADRAVREHPYEFLAAAAAVGLLTGLLLGRRNR